MDFSNMILRAALNRITSSFASSTSSTNSFITRVLSFTGSFNDRTSLLHARAQTEEAGAAPPPPPPPEAPEAAEPAAASSVTTTAADHPFDIEAGTTTTTTLAPTATATAPDALLAAGQEEAAAAIEVDDDAESRRVGKSVQTVCLFVASASLVLFVNLRGNKHGLLYSADMAFIGLGFFSSLGLSIFSILARPGGGCVVGGAAVARVQKWGMVVAVASVAVAFSLFVRI